MRRIVYWLVVIAVSAFILPRAEAQSPTHVVQPGETLYRIATNYGVTVDALKTANNLSSDRIYAGQVLIIPAAGIHQPAPTLEPITAIVARLSKLPPGTYIVQAGDTLSRIAMSYGLSVEALQAANRLAGTFIRVGQTLAIPNQSGAAPIDATGLPIFAQITISGMPQALPLDCEARSAVDWATFFGVSIDELEFLGKLPVSDNPERGFVGSVYGALGQVPPNPYGVHAGPIATLLQTYGLTATALRNATWEAIRGEIAANRPVIVWVIGHVTDGYALPYTTSDGETTSVAPYEHTVIVMGYTPDAVTILDGGQVYTRSLSSFLNSWGVLGNLAVMHGP